MKKALLLTFISFYFISCQTSTSFELQNGDILFQDGDCGDFCEAIKKVTSGYEGRDFSHNGIVKKEGSSYFVLEAVGKGVSKTPLDEFLQKSVDQNGQPKVIVGRLKPEYQALIPAALRLAELELGKPYDSFFDLENDAYYCSELIHLSFQKANEGKAIFDTPPMTYLDPDTGEIFSIWEEYFDKLGVPVPEGELGLNPGGMSTSPVLDIVFDYQDISDH